MNTVMARLKVETKNSHRAAERTTQSRRMLAGTLTVDDYGQQLLAFRSILRTLESKLEACPEAPVTQVWSETPSRLPHLDLDVEALGVGWARQDVQAATRRAQWSISTSGSDNPVAWLGWLYVFEGSSLGAQVLLPRITRSLPLTTEQTHYFRGHGEQTRAVWGRFCERMNACVDPSDADDVVEAAQLAFLAVHDVFDAIEAARCRRPALSLAAPSL